MKQRIGLVLEGGGVRGAYTAGALAWLQDHQIHFDYSVGISSGAAYLCCYLCNDEHTPKNMATIYAADPHLVGMYALFHCGYYVDYRKIFETYLLEKEHMSIAKIREEQPDMEIGAYDLNQGKTIYFGPEDLDDQLNVIRGACSLPVASEIVDWHGYRLLDGGITKMIPIERAIEKGCTKCLVITTKPADYVRPDSSKIVIWLMKHIYKECPQVAKDYKVRKENYYKQRKIIDDMIAQGNAVNILPSVDIKVSRWKGDHDNCVKLYDLGYQDMETRKEEVYKLLQEDQDE